MFAPFAFMGPKDDADATVYIEAINTAGGSLSSAEETAIQTFFKGLKDDGIYSKISVMYPFLGGVAASNGINAINPGTDDLTFNGTWTHSVSGSYASKSSANYADTGFNTSASLDMTTNNGASIVLTDRDTGGPTYGYSGVGVSGDNYFILEIDSTWVSAFNATGTKAQVSLGSSTTGGVMIVNSRTGASSWFGGGILSGSAASGGLSFTSRTDTVNSVFDGNFYINKINSVGYEDGGRYMFAHIGQGLSTTEADNLLIKVNNLQTAFSRNIFS